MINELQKMALAKISELMNDADILTLQLCTKMIKNSGDVKPEIDIYPIGKKMKEAGKWVNAILEDQEN